MSILFHSSPAAPAHIAFHNAHDTVSISSALWDTLGRSQSPQRLAVSISPSRPPRGKNSLKSLVAWATPSSDKSSEQRVTVPSTWKAQYPSVFSESSSTFVSSAPQCTLVATAPVILTEVFVVAHSKSAFDLAKRHPAELEAWLSHEQRILRLGDHHTCGCSDGSLYDYEAGAYPDRFEFKLAMTDPVLQGYAKVGVTRFYIIPGSWPTGNRLNGILNGQSNFDVPEIPDELLTDGVPSVQAVDEDVGDEAFEIDESFLASSTLRSLSFTSPHRRPDVSGSPTFLNGASSNGDHSHSGSLMLFSGSTFTAKALAEPIELQHDLNATILVRTADLGKTGVFDGDWAILCASDTSDYRLVRVFTADQLIKTGDTALVSPVLLHNLHTQKSLKDAVPILLRASPFGGRPPSVPTAKSATLARIASAASTDRALQPLFLHALKAHFDNEKRMVKKGDVIAVAINTDNAREFEEVHENTEGHDSEAPSAGGPSNTVVYFVVTNLEHDILTNSEDKSRPDSYIGSTMGELGCWIDSNVTKMVQVGIEHSLVPDTARFLGIDFGAPPVNPEVFHDAGPIAPFAPLRRFYDLASASFRPNAADYELSLSILLKGARGIGKYTTACRVARRLGLHVFDVNCFDLIGETDVKTEGTLRARFDKAESCSPCIFMLRNIDALAQTTQVLETGKEPAIVSALRECIEDLTRQWKLSGFPVLVVGTTSNVEKVPVGVLSCFKQEINFEAPGERERLDILSSLVRDMALAPDVSLKSIATQTAALVAADLNDLIIRAKQSAIEHISTSIMQHGCTHTDITHAGVLVTGADFDRALGKARSSYSQSIGAPKIPNVSWDDVGGLANVKADILDTIQLPLEHPELIADGLKKRSGILLYGPPGTGKTLLAKAVATSCSLNFFSVKGPELLNMYIGESEANVRRVFQRARDAKPCVIFFDELDSVAPKRGNHGDSGGVMDRIVSQLLAELDGMSDGKGGSDVFVIGATNRPDLLDPALLRPGRFDRMLYLGVSDTHDAQLNILEALTRKFRLDPGLDLRNVAEQCPYNYTGADFYALCSDAMLKAMSRKAEEIEDKIAELNKGPEIPGHPYPLTPQYYLSELATAADTDVLVSQRDFEQALEELVPSVSQSEMNHYAAVQHRFAGETLNSIDRKGKGKQNRIEI